MPSKLSYSVDSQNRLTYSSGRKSALTPFQTTIDGRFAIDKNNQLTYTATDPSNGGVKKICLDGKWALDDEHNLVCSLDASESNKASKLKIQGEIIQVDVYSLAFAVETKNSNGKMSMYTLTLSGKWQADKNNCLTFTIERETGRTSTLTFTGIWEINKQHELIYTIKQSSRLTTTTLTFQGHWDIVDRNRISYCLSQGSDSQFTFNVQFARYDNRIKAFLYTIALGAKPQEKTLTLKGSWKMTSTVGLMFEMKYADDRVHSIIFGATCTLINGTLCEVKLKNTNRKSLGIEIQLSRDIFKGDGNVFLRGMTQGDVLEVVAGFGVRF